MNRIFRIITPALFALTVLISHPAKAIELGLTPSDVFGLWTNINKVILDFGRTHLSDKAAIDALIAVQAKSHTNKTPTDVLGQVDNFRKISVSLHQDHKGSAVDQRLEDEIIFLIRHHNEGTTPSVVFMRSSDVLIEMAHSLFSEGDTRLLVSRYFAEHLFNDKTPSDVYSLVSLAIMRLGFVLGHASYRHPDAAAPLRESGKK
jgi:hypothetical protein